MKIVYALHGRPLYRRRALAARGYVLVIIKASDWHSCPQQQKQQQLEDWIQQALQCEQSP